MFLAVKTSATEMGFVNFVNFEPGLIIRVDPNRHWVRHKFDVSTGPKVNSKRNV